MKSFKDISLRWQLGILTVSISVLALLAAGVVLITHDVGQFREQRFEQLDSITKLIAVNAEAALAFDDNVAVDELLVSLRSQPFIERAELRSLSGAVISKYTKSSDGPSEWDKNKVELSPGRHITEQHLILVTELRVNDYHKGSFYIFSDLEDLKNKIQSNTQRLFLVLICCVLLASILAFRFQKFVSAPLNALLEAVSRITHQGDYSARVDKDRENELGIIVDNFNSMLEEIQSRDQNLEAEVKTRTRELESREGILKNIVAGVELGTVLAQLVV